MNCDASGLSATERQMIDALIEACRHLESIYWRQSDPTGLALYNALAADGSPLAKSVRHYLFINGSRWDLVRENQPFVGGQPMPPGRSLYPPGATRAAIEAYVAAHPDAKAAVYDPFTVLHENGSTYTARKYHEE